MASRKVDRKVLFFSIPVAFYVHSLPPSSTVSAFFGRRAGLPDGIFSNQNPNLGKFSGGL
jgi:hypothetical protein